MALADERAKRIKLYKNGDMRFYGKDVVINKRCIRTWGSFLQTCTVDLKTNEAVRSIRTPTHGHMVKSLDDLKDNCQYVAVGNGRYKQQEYVQLADGPPKILTSPRYNLEPVVVRPVEHNRKLQVSGRIRKIPTDVLTIFVYPNGKDLEAARRVTITHKMMKDWDTIISYVNDRVTLTAGACRKLYTTEGALVNHTSELQSNCFYVAVGPEVGGFRHLQYGAKRPAFNNSPKREKNNGTRGSDNSMVTPPRRLDPLPPPRTRKNRKSYHSEPANGSLDHSTVSASDRAKSEGRAPANNRARGYGNRPPAKKNQDDIFHAKPVKHKRQSDAKQVDYDKDEGGMFKAKGADNRDGAEEVEETKDTAVDLPIDQVEAEEIKDEEIESEEGKNKKASTPRSTPTTRRSPRETTPLPPISPAARTPTPKSSPLPKDVVVTPPPLTPIKTRTPSPAPQSPVEDNVKSPSPAPETPAENKRKSPSPAPKSPVDDRQDSPVKEKEEAKSPSPTEDKTDRIPTPQNEDDTDERNQAATQIQAGFKGYKSRQQVNEMKQAKKEDKETKK